MFYVYYRIHTTLRLKPINLHKLDDQQFIQDQLRLKLSGRCYEDYGFIIQVFLDQENQQNEAIIDEDGSIKLLLKCTAILFKPYIGEVLECFVEQNMADMIKASIGPAEVLINRNYMSDQWEFINGYWIDQLNREEIKPDDKLRIQVVSYEIQGASNMVIKGRIDKPYLGLVV